MLIIKIITLGVLLAIFIQDIVSRSVYWILFPLLAILFIIIRLSHQTISEIWLPMLVNCCFLLLQLLFVSAWFSIKNGNWINIMSDSLGWGDVLFLICAAFYLSVSNFLLFYMASLIIILMIWLLGQKITGKKSKQIPMAGFQALIFTILLTGDWWVIHLNLTDNNWFLYLMEK